jgi:formyltetrahydrofolate hydrolase
LRTEAIRIYEEAVHKNNETINTAFDYYVNKMNSLLKDNYFFKERSFAKSENTIREETMNLFKEKCKFGDQSFIKQFSDQLTNKLIESYKEYYDLNETNIEKLISNTELCLNDLIKSYTENISKFELISNKTDLENKHKEFTEKANLMLDEFNIPNNSNFIIPYKTKLNEEIKKIYSETKHLFAERMINFKTFCENKVEETFNLCVKVRKYFSLFIIFY